MTDYEVLDISGFCSAGADVRTQVDYEPAAWPTDYRGIPFRFVPDMKSCFVCLGRRPDSSAVGASKISIPIGKTARNVIFAHAMLESFLERGDSLGRTVGIYTFVYADGSSVEAPIRERFEIAAIPIPWGFLPFASLPDGRDGLHTRGPVPPGEAGNRQQEVGLGWPGDYYLWVWENPRPEVPLDRVELRAAEPSERSPGRADALGPHSQTLDEYGNFPLPGFVVGAITLGHLDEKPFHQSAAVPVKLTLLSPELAQKNFNLDVTVDRGVATYVYALPLETPVAFLASGHAGFGEEQNLTSSPAYVEIAATPSATLTVKQGEDEIAQANWGEIESRGSVETERVRIEVIESGRNWVHTTVLDADTGKPVPCRIHFRSPHGVPYQPHGHHGHVNSNLGTWHIDIGGDVRLSQITYAYIDGKCQGWLPRGEVIVDAARGYEYEPLRQTVTIQPGQRELTLRLKRKHNLNAERYFSGDTHVHFLSSQGALLEASGEDLDVVNLLQSQWGHLFTNTEEFTGKPHVSGDKETIVYATQENRQHILGHLTLLGLKEPVMPWCSDGPGEAEMGGNLETTLSRWADVCHAQGGTVVIPHMPNPNAEPAVLIATGRADAVEMIAQNMFLHVDYYRYLNAGYRLPITGGTDKMDAGVPVGLYRTYAWIPPDEEFTYDNWLKALRSGNTFISGGPLLRFKVNGQTMGSTIHLGRDGGTLDVECSASSIIPVHTLQIVQGGEVVAHTQESAGAKELTLRAQLKIDGSTWLCARCGGPDYHIESAPAGKAVRHFDSWRRAVCAHTSPVYIQVGETYDVCSPASLQYMLTLVDGSLQHIRRAPQWKPGHVTHHHHSHDHLEYLEGPLREAAQAIHKKMHEHGIPH
ncbi:MAG: CehA/McbA family metallohydrolase [Armatimonadetes bacterium]|nr:CehA/McbA family metallohydrolase [Armatimonadota bacterium]